MLRSVRSGTPCSAKRAITPRPSDRSKGSAGRRSRCGAEAPHLTNPGWQPSPRRSRRGRCVGRSRRGGRTPCAARSRRAGQLAPERPPPVRGRSRRGSRVASGRPSGSRSFGDVRITAGRHRDGGPWQQAATYQAPLHLGPREPRLVGAPGRGGDRRNRQDLHTQRPRSRQHREVQAGEGTREAGCDDVAAPDVSCREVRGRARPPTTGWRPSAWPRGFRGWSRAA